MKSFLLVAATFCALLSVAGELPDAAAAGFEDPNIKALHKSVDEMLSKAEKGDPEAQNGQGMINLYGFGGAQDLVAAKSWFEKAANQGYPEAIVQLGNLYENGMGVEKDVAKAADLYRKAAALNYPQGMFRLGLLNFDGIGMVKNEAEGQKLLRLACDTGYRTSCGLLMWHDNKLSEARATFNLQCQAGDQIACGYLAQIEPVLGGDEAAKAKEQTGMGVYLIIGLILVGLLIFWLIRSDPGEDEQKSV